MDELTDAEWHEFQSIPDHGYSHRAWIDERITERLATAWDAGRESGIAAVDTSGYGGIADTPNPYRKPHEPSPIEVICPVCKEHLGQARAEDGYAAEWWAGKWTEEHIDEVHS